MTTAEQLRAEGFVEGYVEGFIKGHFEILTEGRDKILDHLALKFGPLSPDLIDRVNAAPLDQIIDWTRNILDAEKIDDVFR